MNPAGVAARGRFSLASTRSTHPSTLRIMRPAPLPRQARTVPAGAAAAGTGSKVVWLETSNQDVLTAALEVGFGTVLFGPQAVAAGRDKEWQQLGRFQALAHAADGSILDLAGSSGGSSSGESSSGGGSAARKVGAVRRLACADDLRAAEREAGSVQGFVVMDATDWQIIPAENLVAAYQHNPGATLLAAAPDAATSRVMLEALETGTDGVLLRTDSPAEVRALARYLQERRQQGAGQLQYETATVTAVRPVGMGDRACVDLCSLLQPGEGLLVGSFARCMLLVHSECAESRYIASRPFRVNAGPVHAYLQLPGGKTGYLSELRSGSEVLVAGPDGSTRTALVGRVKIEARPLVLVEAELPDGGSCSALLQNAETVRLVGPSPACAAGGSASETRGNTSGSSSGSGSKGATSGAAGTTGAAEEGYVWQQGGTSGANAAAVAAGQAWRAVSVSDLAPGDRVLVLRQEGARHTGVAIQEAITER